MQKTIWEKYAEVLVDYSTNVQKGDLVQIRATSIYAKDLVKAVYKRCSPDCKNIFWRYVRYFY